MQRAEKIKAEALRLGFDFAGITHAQNPARAASYRDWLRCGFHGEMAWLEKNVERRVSPTLVLPGAQSVVSVGLSYFTADPPPDRWDHPLHGRIARYAWGKDYHDVMAPMLKELAQFIEAEVGGKAVMRSYVDTGPVLEKEIAARAGQGFVGKNTLLINERFGSYVFVGEILCAADLEADPLPSDQGTCGSCRRCQDICPTHAFPAPYILDGRKCISYLTIELKAAIPMGLRPLMKNWIYGCDECQSVCPWVRQYSRAGRQRFLKMDPDFVAPRLADVMALSDAEFRERYRGTPIVRTKRRGLLRNAAVALGNSGLDEAREPLERAIEDPEPLIREHAAWALGRLDAVKNAVGVAPKKS